MELGDVTAETVEPEPCDCGRPGGACMCGEAEASGPGDDSTPGYVYAIGTIEPRFPNLAVEKEFAQAAGRSDAKSLTDRQALQAVLGKPEGRYLARQICYVLVIAGLESYLVLGRDSADVALLVDAMRAEPGPLDLDVVIGIRGPIASPQMCNGLMVPVLVLDQLYSFDRNELIQAIPRPEDVEAKQFDATAEALLERILRLADNAGATDEHRALNYLAVRYGAIYAKAAEQYGRGSSLTEIDVRRSTLSGVRSLVDVVFSFTDRSSDFTESFSVRVDVTEEFPFLASKLTPHIDH